MAKVWINPAFKDKVKELPVKEEEINKSKPPVRRKERGRLFPHTSKITHSENYFNKRIKENTIVEIVFIGNVTLLGTVEWVDERYLKIIEGQTGDNILIERRAIKYIKKRELE